MRTKQACLLVLSSGGTLAAMSSDPDGTPAGVNHVFDDLVAEGNELERLVADRSDADWRRQTPAPGWTIAHQIAHLMWTDEKAVLATTDQDGFTEELKKALANAQDYVDGGARDGAALPKDELFARWRASRAAIQDALRAAPPKAKLPWFGPPMSAASMATGRLMETWAHGLDVADALGVRSQPTTRLWHVARIGVRARDHAYLVNSLPPPAEPFRVELTAPDGTVWAWGPADAAGRVSGPAFDFCLVVTQRRHRADTELNTVGAEAEHWLGIAQAFAGPPGAGRAPGQFS
jgi:uncharacterized protein (TIGR03084 family)